MEKESISVTAPPPSNSQYYGFYRGRVVEHGHCGTCRIWIPEVYPSDWESNPKFLPVAEQAQPFTVFGSQPKFSEDGENTTPNGVPGGVYSYPAIGSYVWCFFVNGNIENPVYFAACVNINPDSEDDWENVELSKTSKGLKFHYYLPSEEEGDGQLNEVTMDVFTKNSQRAVKLKVGVHAKEAENIVNNSVKIDNEGIQLFTNGKIKLTGLQGVEIDGINVALEAKNKINLNAPCGAIAITSPLITLDCTSSGDHNGHFLLKYWNQFMGKIKAVTRRYPL